MHEWDVSDIIAENKNRNKDIKSAFDPISGIGSIGDRSLIYISDFPIQKQLIPTEMMNIEFVKLLNKYGSVDIFLKEYLNVIPNCSDREKVIDKFIRIRCLFDFAFWAYLFVMISNTGGGDDVHFKLNRPQRRLISVFEKQRLSGKPIRVIVAKARQWGGSTATQIYMSWLQLVLHVGMNSLIVGHQKDSSTEVQTMFEKMIDAYPIEMLHKQGEEYKINEPKFVGVGTTMNIHKVPQRNCKIKLGSAEKPDSARGGDSPLVHCTEVAFWKKTEGKKPEDIIRAACSGALPNNKNSMIVYESSPNGSGNFFQKEYDAAKKHETIFMSLFIAWWQIEKYTLPFKNDDDKADFAIWIYENRNNKNVTDDRHECGQYLFYLWELGATLEAINWYIAERSTHSDHASMASEFPSDDDEAFTYSGARVFDKPKVNKFRGACKPPKFIGDIYGDSTDGKDALKNVKFIEDKQGLLWIWGKPEIDKKEKILYRYLVVVDIGGRSNKADWSVITVFDRLWMIDGEKPTVVAQWYGHIDMDILAWKSAQIAKYYDDAYLVIESNTLETKDRDRYVDGDQSLFILNEIKGVYDNLYARKQSDDEIAEGVPVKYGFHTNVATKPKIIALLVKIIREHLYVERDERCLEEYLTYERKQNGAFGAIIGKHDDLLMTRAIGLWVCYKEMEIPRIVLRIRNLSVKRNAVSAATI